MKADFEYQESGIVQQMVAIATGVIVIGMITVIGLAIMASTANNAQTNINALPADLGGTDANTAVKTTFTTVSTVTGYYPLLFLAVIGGLALAAFIGFMYVRGKGGSGSM